MLLGEQDDTRSGPSARSSGPVSSRSPVWSVCLCQHAMVVFYPVFPSNLGLHGPKRKIDRLWGIRVGMGGCRGLGIMLVFINE